MVPTLQVPQEHGCEDSTDSCGVFRAVTGTQQEHASGSCSHHGREDYDGAESQMMSGTFPGRQGRERGRTQHTQMHTNMKSNPKGFGVAQKGRGLRGRR